MRESLQVELRQHTPEVRLPLLYAHQRNRLVEGRQVEPALRPVCGVELFVELLWFRVVTHWLQRVREALRRLAALCTWCWAADIHAGMPIQFLLVAEGHLPQRFRVRQGHWPQSITVRCPGVVSPLPLLALNDTLGDDVHKLDLLDRGHPADSAPTCRKRCLFVDDIECLPLFRHRFLSGL